MIKGASDITERYYETTSSRSGSMDALHYQRFSKGMTLRLGPWLPVRGDRVLDLGCGLGEMCGLAVERGAAMVVGVDLCAEEIELARKHVRGEFVKDELTEFLHAETRVFDWIGCLNILEHLPKDRIVETLQLARERLKPGGVLVAMVPNAISPMGSVTRHWDFTHEWAFTPNNFRQLARLCGYAEPEFRECGPVPHGMVSGIRWLLWQGLRLCIMGRLMVEVADRKDGIYTMDMLVRMKNPLSKVG